MLGVTVLLCLSASIVWGETMDDLVKRDGLYFKKFTEVPFTGKIEGKRQGNFKNGRKEGSWVFYHDIGQLKSKGDWKNGFQEGPWIEYWKNGQLYYKCDFKNGKRVGSWVGYWDNGSVWDSRNGTFKNGKKISD